MLLRYSSYFNASLRRLHITYKRWQSVYDDLAKKLRSQGVEVSKSKSLEPPVVDTSGYGNDDWCLWFLDDVGGEICASPQFARLLATLRHRRIQALILLHRAFSGSAVGRAVTGNLGVLVFTGSRRQLGDVRSMSAQLGFAPSMQAAFLRVCRDRDRLSHLLVDLQPNTPDDIRLRARRISESAVICFPHRSIFHKPAFDVQEDDDEEIP